MQRMLVVGAGTMGHGIAHVAAAAGLDVALYDAFPGAAERGLASVRANLDAGVAKGKVTADARDAALARLRTVATLGEGADGADVIVEAVPEDLALKQRVLGEAAAVAPAGAVLASNTSSLSIGALASALPGPERVIGAHFFNPVHLMPLLEVVVGAATSPDVVAAVRALGERLGKDVIVVRDSPGFATSRLGVCLGMEAIRMLEEGVASAEDIDKAMVLGYRHPIGPLRLTDLVGLDVRLAIGEHLATTLGNPAFSPPGLMRRKVHAGELGKKTGRGFYEWGA
jgi:3-hydroxybutyryl-CoA dehydrogenase